MKIGENYIYLLYQCVCLFFLFAIPMFLFLNIYYKLSIGFGDKDFFCCLNIVSLKELEWHEFKEDLIVPAILFSFYLIILYFCLDL